VLVAALAWSGVDAVANRFAAASWGDVGGRLGAWQDAISVIRDFPLAGTGLNTYSTSMLVYQTFEADAYHFAQTHNDYLQLAAEGGVLVGLPALAILGLFVRTTWRRFHEPSDEATYWLRAGAVIGMIAIGLQEVVDFSLQMPGNAALFAAMAAIAVHRGQGARAERLRPERGAGGQRGDAAPPSEQRRGWGPGALNNAS
jgi:O-antigen ligase